MKGSKRLQNPGDTGRARAQGKPQPADGLGKGGPKASHGLKDTGHSSGGSAVSVKEDARKGAKVAVKDTRRRNTPPTLKDC